MCVEPNKKPGKQSFSMARVIKWLERSAGHVVREVMGSIQLRAQFCLCLMLLTLLFSHIGWTWTEQIESSFFNKTSLLTKIMIIAGAINAQIRPLGTSSQHVSEVPYPTA